MTTPVEVLVPDIGGFTDVTVIEVLVADGQQIDKETPLITIETEKAAMDVPAPAAGRVAQMKLRAGDKVSQGSLILLLEPAEGPVTAAPMAAETSRVVPPAATPAAAPVTSLPDQKPPITTAAAPASGPPNQKPAISPAAAPASTGPSHQPAIGVAAAPPRSERSDADSPAPGVGEAGFSKAHASPSTRKLARELGVDLGAVPGTGPKGRIMPDDIKAHVKRLLTAPAPVSGLPKVADVDFARFGPIVVQPLSRIQRISGARLQASWINVPHVTQHDDADITELEAMRQSLKLEAAQAGVRLTPLAFIVKACVLALKEFPRFNASLDPAGENLVLKQYFHLGFAADTPAGLVVPVIRDADRCNLFEVARSLAALSEAARAGKLTAAQMQGGTFTVSSLGGIGGTSFTPIINAPEVAILGVSRSALKPVYERGAFLPRLTLPLSLSYDHRVIDGAQAARFLVHLAKLLGDPKALV